MISWKGRPASGGHVSVKSPAILRGLVSGSCTDRLRSAFIQTRSATARAAARLGLHCSKWVIVMQNPAKRVLRKRLLDRIARV